MLTSKSPIEEVQDKKSDRRRQDSTRDKDEEQSDRKQKGSRKHKKDVVKPHCCGELVVSTPWFWSLGDLWWSFTTVSSVELSP